MLAMQWEDEAPRVSSNDKTDLLSRYRLFHYVASALPE